MANTEGGEVSDRARALFDEALVWDMVWPWEPWCGNDYDKLRRFHAVGVNVVSVTIAGDSHTIAQAVARVAEARRLIGEYADCAVLCESLADIDAARAAGKLAVLMHFEGTRCFERNLDMVDAFYRLGVRHTLLAFNQANSAAGGCAERDDGGLTGFGQRLIREMERVGMLLDLSHVGHRSALQAMELASKPCVYTHSLINAVYPHYRNLADEEIRAVAQTGGAVGVSGGSMYHGDLQCLPQTLFRHLDHVVQLVGPDHAVIGIDSVFDPEPLAAWMKTRPDEWPGVLEPDWPGVRFFLPEQLPGLVECMLEAGYSDAAVRQILGGNYRRICQATWS